MFAGKRVGVVMPAFDEALIAATDRRPTPGPPRLGAKRHHVTATG